MPYLALGLCRGHYSQNRRNQGQLSPLRSLAKDKECRADGLCAECVERPRQCGARCNRCAHIWTNFKLRHADFMAKLDGQGGRCEICRTDSPGGRFNKWHVDHDRACCPGKQSCGSCIRGILCNSCNVWILPVLEAQQYLAALEYLRRHKREG